MAGERSTRRAVAAGVPATLLLAFANPAPAAALQQVDYPTWDEVEQARQSEAATAAKIEEIEGLLFRLETQAAELNREALERGEDYVLAQAALDETTAKLDRLRAQATAAEERAEESERRISFLVAQLARTGGGDVTLGLLLGSAADADGLLARLGIADRVSSSAAGLLDQAIYDKKVAEALAADARAAESERVRLAAAAEDALVAAEAAAEQARARADAQQVEMDRMCEQLARLKGTTADLERQYAEGQAAAPTPPTTTPPTTGTPTTPSPSPTPSTPASPPATPSPTPSTPPAPTPAPAPVSSVVERAIAFATSQVGDRYQLGGMGPDAWDCSGLAKASYASAGVYIGIHSSTDQYNYMASRGRLVPLSQMQRGDLLFYSEGGSASNPRKYHVAIYLGNGKMVEAPNPTARVRIVNVRSYDLVPFAGRPTG